MLSRPQKLSHLDTIQYEIDMLNYCFERLLEQKWQDVRDIYVYLEGFLLHYRNLIEFFGDAEDLKVSESEVWSPRTLSERELAPIRDAGPLKRYRGVISQYLQHCTKKRIEDRDWDVEAMYEELKLVLDNFRRLFPVQPLARTVAVRSSDSKSTASFSTATITVLDSGLSPHTPFLPGDEKTNQPK